MKSLHDVSLDQRWIMLITVAAVLMFAGSSRCAAVETNTVLAAAYNPYLDPSPSPRLNPDVSGWTPFQLTIGSYYQLFPKEKPVCGLGLDALGGAMSDHVIGLQTGVGSIAGSLTGAQISLGGNQTSNACGVQASIFFNLAEQIAGLQLGLLINDAGSITGAQVSPVGNRATTVDCGVQLGWINQVDLELKGLQFGIMNNPGYREYLGADVSGREWYRDAGDNHSNSTGVQLALLNGGRSLKGVQIAGLLNSCAVSGVQISGLMNGPAGFSRGVQIAMFNGAKRMNGVQFGLYNECDELSGLQIGLWNRSGGSAWPLFRIGFSKSAATKDIIQN